MANTDKKTTNNKLSQSTKKVTSKVKEGARKVKNSKTSTKVGVVATLGVAAALAAGAYYLYGTTAGTKRRRQMRGWMLKMKGDVIESLEKLKDVNEDTYHKVVEDVSKKYKQMKKVDTDELLVLVSDLKKHWSTIKKDLKEARKEIEGNLPEVKKGGKAPRSAK